MTNDQEDLLLMLARIVLNQCRGQRPMAANSAEDEFAQETARLLDELKPYDLTAGSEVQK